MYQNGAAHGYTAACEHRAVGFLDRIAGRRDAASRARLEDAADAVARELAGNLELTAMFDQTHQAVVFENAQFARHRALLASEVRDAYAELADVYARMPATEDAMERRGPAASVRPEDRALIERWEGDARSVQRRVLADAHAPPPSLVSTLVRRLRGGARTGR